jgi:hypothetical protein
LVEGVHALDTHAVFDESKGLNTLSIGKSPAKISITKVELLIISQGVRKDGA